MSLSIERRQPESRFFRRLVMILAALAVLALLVGYVWWSWRGRTHAGIETIVVDGAGPAGDRRPQERRGDRIVARKGLVEAFAGPVQMHLETDKRPVLPHLHHDSADRWTNREQSELLEAASRLVRGENRFASLAVSPEQKTQLASLNLYRRMALSESDQQQLTALYAAWEAATAGQPKTDAERKLLAAVRDIGTRATDASRTAITTSAARVKEILTPEQLDKYRQIVRTPRVQQPTTRPPRP